MTRRPTSLPLSLLGAVALTAVLTACSGGDDGSGGQEPVDPKAAYVEAAAKICSDADTEFAGLTPPTAPDQFAPFVSQTVAIAEQAQTDLAALTPPEEDRADLESKVLTPFGSLVEEGKTWSARVTAAGGDQSVLLPLLATRPTSEAVDKEYLRTYGLPTCAEAIARVG